MELNWLEDFLTLSVTGNFSRAAETRHVSQPAFSRRIRNLEYWVGTPLVDRSVYPIALTPAGEAFRKKAGEALNALEYAREEAKGMVSRSEQMISFAALHTLALNFYPAWIGSLQKEIGEIKSRLIADNLSGCVEALMSGSCDLILCYSHPGVPTALDATLYPSVQLAEDAVVPVSAPNSDGEPKHRLFDDQPVPYLCYPPECFLGRIVNPIVETNNLNRHLTFQYENSMAEALKPVAVDGGGLAWLPEIAIRDELATGALVLAAETKFARPISIRLYRSIERSRPEVERLWAFAKSCALPGASQRNLA